MIYPPLSLLSVSLVGRASNHGSTATNHLAHGSDQEPTSDDILSGAFTRQRQRDRYATEQAEV
jgi:hypothetical protein